MKLNPKFFDVNYNEPSRTWYACIHEISMPLDELVNKKDYPVGLGSTAVYALLDLINKIEVLNSRYP